MVDRTNHIWRVVIYVILLCDGKVSRSFPYFLYMVDSTKRPASVGLAQARPNKKQFWSYIKWIQKEHSGVSSLIVNGKSNSCAQDKARILNNQFESVFTNQDLSNISIITSDATPQMPSISFSAHRIQLLLENLVLEKAFPDSFTTYIFKHCASEIAPILQMLFTQALNTGPLPED